MPAEARGLWVCLSTSLQRPKNASCHMSVGNRRGYKEAVAFGLQGPAEPGSGRGYVGADVWGRHIRQWACVQGPAEDAWQRTCKGRRGHRQDEGVEAQGSVV